MIGKTLDRRHALTAVLFFIGIMLFGGAATLAEAATIYGVSTANALVRFDTAAPAAVTTIGTITGLQPGETIVGIDFRPANGQLYALGSSSRLYTINLVTGAATQVGTAGAFTLSGSEFGFDFNPAVDRIRVVSNTGQNLRLNPDTGGLAATDAPLNPGAPSVTAAAYTNNFAGATSTTLYVIDTATDALYIQNPPNNGTLNLVGLLGDDVAASNGFDIAPIGGAAYAALTVGSTSQLYTINLATGAATLVGPVGGNVPLRGISVAFGSAAANTAALDFDGDRRADYAVYRLSTNSYFINRSSNNSFFSFPFGLASDVQTPGDYDGDGRADAAVWRPSNGTFYVLRSSTGSVQFFQFGLNGDEPVARDYDGDGRTDFAVVRRSGGVMTWYIANSSNGTVRIQQFGLDSDVTAPGDYDGDGRFDLAVFRTTGAQQGTFFVLRSTLGPTAVQWGIGSDLVVPGDYDGDGRTDYAVVRVGTQYTWFVLLSGGGVLSAQWGIKPHLTVQADYDGDGRTNIATWDPATGIFYVLNANGTATEYRFGMNGDYPIANYDTH
ncbi:MAG: DUF4394 domain-containing protein [Pyrinomonadaceae bacterium]